MPDQETATRTRKNDELMELKLAQVVTSKTNPRKHFDPKAMEDLRASVKAKGIVVPIVVRSVNSHYELVAGERRFRIATELKLPKIFAIVKDLTDEEALEIQVIENLQRADVHPLDEAEGYHALTKRGYKIAQLATKVGKSESYVLKRLKLLDLTTELQKEYLAGKFHFAHAQVLCRLKKEDQQKIGKKLFTKEYEDIAAQLISVRDLVKLAEEAYVDLKEAQWPLSDATLVPEAGACSACPKNTAVQSDLFPDHVGRRAHCTDGGCFKNKLKAMLAATAKSVEEKQGEKCEAVFVSPDSWNVPSGIVEKGKWKRADKLGACPTTKMGVMAATDRYSSSKEKKGDRFPVCTNLRCKKHFPKPSKSTRLVYTAPKRDPHAEKVQAWQRKVEDEVDRRLVQAIVDKLPGKLDGKKLAKYFDNYFFDSLQGKAVAAAFGVKHNSVGPSLNSFTSLTGEKLVKLIYLVGLDHDYGLIVDRANDEFKIDRDKIEAAVKKEFPEPVKKEVKAKKAKAGKKAKTS